MKIGESTRRYVVTGIILFVAIGLIVASVIGKKQDSAFQADEAQYNMVLALIQEGKYEDALILATGLEERHNGSEEVHYLIALAANSSGDKERAARHFQRVLDINPHKVEDAMLMLQYAEVLVSKGEKTEASEVLEICSTFETPEEYPEYQEVVTELQAQLAVQS